MELEEVASAPSVLEEMIMAGVASQSEAAQRRPRNEDAFIEKAIRLATASEARAEQCRYTMPRDGKIIEGPSARLGELILYAWGNCAAGARVVTMDREFVYAQGFYYDIERNIRIMREVQRRITYVSGHRYPPDQIAMTANAACSIVQRNVTLAGVPEALWGAVYDEVRTKVLGTIDTLPERLKDTLARLAKFGVTEARVLAMLKLDKLDGIGLEELATLKGMHTALREGEGTADEMFPAPVKATTEPEKPRGVAGVRAAVRKGGSAPDGAPPQSGDSEGSPTGAPPA